MTYVLQHKTTGHYCTVRPSQEAFHHSPNLEDAFRFLHLAEAESERRKLEPFSGSWMAVQVEE